MARVRLKTVAARPAGLPLVCMVCGRPAEVHVVKNFAWRPAWVATAFRVSLFVLCIPVALVFMAYGYILTRRATIDGPMCERHRNYWLWRGFWFTAPLLVMLIGIVALGILMLRGIVSGERYGLFFLATFGLLLVWAVAAALLRLGSIRVTEITDDEIVLDGVSREFAEAVGGPRRPVRAAAPTTSDDWEPYDPYPRGTNSNPVS
jgi:hypothetical protein